MHTPKGKEIFQRAENCNANHRLAYKVCDSHPIIKRVKEQLGIQLIRRKRKEPPAEGDSATAEHQQHGNDKYEAVPMMGV